MATLDDHSSRETEELRLLRHLGRSLVEDPKIAHIDIYGYGIDLTMMDGSGYEVLVSQTHDKGELDDHV